MPNYTAALANGGQDPVNHIYPAKLGEVLDVVVQNKAGPTVSRLPIHKQSAPDSNALHQGFVEAHPWHFHGNKYWDMGGGTGNFSYEAYNSTLTNGTGTPILRDTSIVYSGPGASYAGKNITAYAPGGWRLFRLKVEVVRDSPLLAKTDN